MIAIISAVFLAMKAPVAVEAHAAGVPRLSLVQWLLFTSFFGMRPEVFAAKPVAGGGRRRAHRARRDVGPRRRGHPRSSRASRGSTPGHARWRPRRSSSALVWFSISASSISRPGLFDISGTTRGGFFPRRFSRKISPSSGANAGTSPSPR